MLRNFGLAPPLSDQSLPGGAAGPDGVRIVWIHRIIIPNSDLTSPAGFSFISPTPDSGWGWGTTLRGKRLEVGRQLFASLAVRGGAGE